jgi:hypothetical protein
MAIVEELLELEDTSTQVVDFAVMELPKENNPVVPPPAPSLYDPSRHGTWAQWVAPGIALLGVVIMVLLQIHFRNEDSSAKSSDEHINSVIDAKLNPAVKGLNDSFDTKLGPINKQLESMNRAIGQVQGKLGIFEANQAKTNKRIDQQTSLARLVDPNRVLAMIRTAIETAEFRGTLLPVSDVNDYRNAVQALPSSAHEYWTTVAAIINYQSLINQMSGEAPNPANVSKPCALLTNGGNLRSFNNSFTGFNVSNCVVDLDTQEFSNGTFTNSVVRYRGGPVTLDRVRFVNCRFVLGLKTPPSTPAQENLLLALLASPDQKTIQISK